MGLPWFRADTNLPTHDKILELVGKSPKGRSAGFVYFCSLAYSAGHETSGVIKRAALPFVHGTPSDAQLLSEVRLWEVIEGGWRIRNWGTRQLVGAESQAIHDTAVEAGRKGGQQKAINQARGVANG